MKRIVLMILSLALVASAWAQPSRQEAYTEIKAIDKLYQQALSNIHGHRATGIDIDRFRQADEKANRLISRLEDGYGASIKNPLWVCRSAIIYLQQARYMQWATANTGHPKDETKHLDTYQVSEALGMVKDCGDSR